MSLVFSRKPGRPVQNNNSEDRVARTCIYGPQLRVLNIEDKVRLGKIIPLKKKKKIYVNLKEVLLPHCEQVIFSV